jgi:excinuclease UvrABC helicase subunit UvrB
LSGAKHQVLLGVTGSGKTFAVVNVIKNVNKPLVIPVQSEAGQTPDSGS